MHLIVFNPPVSVIRLLLCCAVARVCECGGGPRRGRFQVGAIGTRTVGTARALCHRRCDRDCDCDCDCHCDWPRGAAVQHFGVCVLASDVLERARAKGGGETAVSGQPTRWPFSLL